jgi:hypothetical protein
MKAAERVEVCRGLAGRESGWKKAKEGVEGGGEETGMKRESALRDC